MASELQPPSLCNEVSPKALSTHREFASWALHVAAPLSLGAVIYVLWRCDDLNLFRWIDAVGLEDAARDARSAASPLRPRLPDFILFSVPDGAWAYAWSAHFHRLHLGGARRLRLLWALAGPCALVASELGQALHLVPGTFDPLDLLAIAIATATALVPQTLVRSTTLPKESPVR